ncbi:hypothetical protein GCM10028799_31920 [Kribbella italica]
MWADDIGKHRKRLSDAWSEDTRYMGGLDQPDGHRAKSSGQCGVSSAWLIEQLLDRVDASRLSYCYGQVRLGTTPLLMAHCWVEVMESSYEQRWIVDCTADQVEALRRYEVLCWPHDELLDQLEISYDASIARLGSIELTNDLVQKRLDILKHRLRTQESSAA